MLRLLSPDICPHTVLSIDEINPMGEAVTFCILCGRSQILTAEDIGNDWLVFEHHSPQGPSTDQTILTRPSAL